MKQISWDALRAFLCIADKGSLTHAADALSVSVATLARKIDGLEAAFGATLLRRGPHGATLTGQGERVLDFVRSGADQFNQLERLARSMSVDADSPAIRISSTEPMIADVLAPALPQLFDKHPTLSIELEVSLELSNLNRGDADIAIRMVKPKGDTLIARRLPVIEMGLFASKAYLGARNPQKIDIANERLLWYDSAYGDIAENTWLKQHNLKPQVSVRSGSTRALRRAAEAGVGIAPLPRFLAQQTKLVSVSDMRPPDRTPWLVFHRDVKADKRIKVVRDWVVAACNAAINASANAGR